MIALIGAGLLGLPAAAALGLRGHRAAALGIAPLAALASMVLPSMIALWWPPALGSAGVLAVVTAGMLGALGFLAPRVQPEPARLQAGDGAVAVWILVAGLSGLSLCRHAVFGWDGLSIWLNHAVLLASNAALPTDIFAQEQLAFSHWDYPPLLPSVHAWFLRSGVALHQLPAVLGGLLAATGWTVYLALRQPLGSAAAALIALAPVSASGLLSNHFSGYADGLMVLLGAGGAAVLITGLLDDDRMTACIGGGLLAACALTKNEGMLLALCCTPLLLLRWRRWPALIPAAGAVLAWRLGLARYDSLPGVVGNMVWQPEQQLAVLHRIGAHVLRGDFWVVVAVLVVGRARARLTLPVLLYTAAMSAVLAGSPAGISWLTEAECTRLLMAITPLTFCTVGAGALWDYRQSRGSGSSSKQAVIQS